MKGDDKKGPKWGKTQDTGHTDLTDPQAADQDSISFFDRTFPLISSKVPGTFLSLFGYADSERNG